MLYILLCKKYVRIKIYIYIYIHLTPPPGKVETDAHVYCVHVHFIPVISSIYLLFGLTQLLSHTTLIHIIYLAQLIRNTLILYPYLVSIYLMEQTDPWTSILIKSDFRKIIVWNKLWQKEPHSRSKIRKMEWCGGR